MIRVVLGALVSSWAAEPPPTTETSIPPVEPVVIIEEIEETTVGDLDGHRVPMGNVTRGSYRRADGSTGKGNICSLVLPGQSPGVFVGKGSVVVVGESRWEVVRVDNPSKGLGNITLKRLD